MGYKFDFGGDAVEIPQLDAFMNEFITLCERHSVGFANDYREGYGLTIVPFHEADWGIFTDNLDNYEGGVPFLDAAKHLSQERKLAQQSAEWAKRQAEEAKREAQNALIRGDHLRIQVADYQFGLLKTNGIDLPDGHYRLVKDA